MSPADDAGPSDGVPESGVPSDGVHNGGAGADADVAALRTRLESIDDVPVSERVAMFEAANATLTRALAELDEV